MSITKKSKDIDYKLPNMQYCKVAEEKSAMLFNKLIWGIDEVCSFTSYARGTIYNLVSRGEIPFHKRSGGRRLVFIPREIINWFKGVIHA